MMHSDTLEPLVLPTDKEILKVLAHGRRETPKNLAAQLSDTTRSYTGDRLRALEHRGYTHSPGPADRSGMYEITTWGRFAIDHINKYNRNYDSLFHRLIFRSVGSQPTSEYEYVGDDTDPDTSHPAPDPNADTTTDWIHLFQHEFNALCALANVDGVTIPSDFRDRIIIEGDSISANDAADLLYTLYFYGLADRHNEMDAYSINETGQALLDADPNPSRLQHGVKRTDIISNVNPK